MKDVWDLHKAADSHGRRVVALRQATADNISRIEATRDVSSIGTATLSKLPPSLFSQPIQSAGVHVSLEFPVPVGGIVFGKPGAKSDAIGIR